MTFVSKTKSEYLLANDRALLECLNQWLGAMSSSLFKPFRHTATFMALCIHSALCDYQKETMTAYMTASKQFEASKKSTSVAYLSLKQKVSDLLVIQQQLDQALSTSFDRYIPI